MSTTAWSEQERAGNISGSQTQTRSYPNYPSTNAALTRSNSFPQGNLQSNVSRGKTTVAMANMPRPLSRTLSNSSNAVLLDTQALHLTSTCTSNVATFQTRVHLMMSVHRNSTKTQSFDQFKLHKVRKPWQQTLAI